MRIRSQFKDYYDKVQALSSFEGVIFNRNLVVLPTEPIPHQYRHLYPVTIGFCGKLYRGIAKPVTRIGQDVVYYEQQFSHMDTCYSLEQFIQNVFRIPVPAKQEREWRRMYEPLFTVTEDKTLFVKHNAPIFIICASPFAGTTLCAHTMTPHKQNDPKGWWNKLGMKGPQRASEAFPSYIPTLKLFNFDTVIPAENAYMEVESFINGVLAVEHREIPEMSNQTKIDQHGFDKSSFRG